MAQFPFYKCVLLSTSAVTTNRGRRLGVASMLPISGMQSVLWNRMGLACKTILSFRQIQKFTSWHNTSLENDVCNDP